MTQGIENKVVIIVGASRGIGAAAARAFAQEKARLALLSRGREGFKVLPGSGDFLRLLPVVLVRHDPVLNLLRDVILNAVDFVLHHRNFRGWRLRFRLLPADT